MAALTAKEELELKNLCGKEHIIAILDDNTWVLLDVIEMKSVSKAASLRELVDDSLAKEPVNWKLNEPESQ